MTSIRAMPRHAFGARQASDTNTKARMMMGTKVAKIPFVDVAGHFLPHSSA
jgi:hypothetical protein